MKKIMMAMSAALMLTACGEHETYGELTAMATQQDAGKSKTITFTFGPEMRQMTRASLAELNITDLWLFDYVGNELKQTVHKSEGFDAVSLSLDYGEHTICFVVSRGSEPTVSAPTISWSKPSDTFWATLSLTVVPGSSITQAVSLHRVAARLRITVTDEIPATLASLSVTPSHWYYGLDITTGEATDDRQTARTVNVPASYVGTTGQLIASFFTISPQSQWTTDITLTATATDNSTLSSINIKDVPMQRNHVTSYGGSILNAGRSVTLTSDEEWIEDDAVTW